MKILSHIAPLAALAAISIIFCACDKSGETPEKKKDNPSQPTTSVLEANPTSLDFDYKGDTKTISIKSSVKPNINCQESWITVTEGSYSNQTEQLTVKVGENTGSAERKGTISVNGDKKTVKIEITQGILEYDFEVDASSCKLPYSGGQFDVNVTSTGTPSAKSDADWCSATVGKISEEHKTVVSIFAAVNMTPNERSTKVTISYGKDSKEVSVTQNGMGEISVAPAEALTPEMVFEAFGMGWNMGNHFDAFSNGVASETVWGNSKATQSTMDGVKAAGFKSVRIPVTWLGHIGEAPAYKIEDAWMERVAEVVEYAHKAGLNVIINTHHDEGSYTDGKLTSGWLDIKAAAGNTTTNQKIQNQIFAMWTQIAERFKDCGEWLTFEPFNEIQDGGWGWSTEFQNNPKKQYDILNQWCQTFVTAVRATGGNNATRWLAIPGYAANIGFTITGLDLPKDYTSANRLIVAVHDYDPYDFTLKCDKPEFGHTAATDKKGGSESDVTSPMDKVCEAYFTKDIPVYIGEMGCSFYAGRSFLFQKYYIEYFVKSCKEHGLPAFLWDNGAKGSGSECHSYIDHGTGKYASDNAKTVVELMMKAMYTEDADYTLESIYKTAPESE